MTNTGERYGTVAMALHWLIALAIIVQLVLGMYMHELDDDVPYKAALYQFHMSLGLTVLMLSLARIVWRFANPAPALPAHMAAWQRILARVTHLSFYVLMLAIPLSGWAMVSTSVNETAIWFFGAFEAPHLPVPRGEETHEELEDLHELLAKLMIALLILHVAAALKHHFRDRDDVLKRMLPASWTR